MKVVSTAKVQKIWEQFTTMCYSPITTKLLFRLQKYKKFESNSQHILYSEYLGCVVSTAKVQKIWEQFTTFTPRYCASAALFRLQKYKKFESNSQQGLFEVPCGQCCFDCKSTKNLRAIHNNSYDTRLLLNVVSTAKVQKIWEQFTTHIALTTTPYCCFDCKSTKNLRAIHNCLTMQIYNFIVVSTAKVQKIWEQFTTGVRAKREKILLFRLQKYKKFESNSQRW